MKLLRRLVRGIKRMRRGGDPVRRRIRLLREADVVFISHAKSGRTWVRAMLSHLYHLEHGVPADRLVDGDNFHRLAPAIPSIFFTHDRTEPPALRDLLRAGTLGGKKVVFLVRDPRDVVVSQYFQFIHRNSPEELRRKGLPGELKTMSMAEFAFDEKLGLPAVIEVMNRWAREVAGLPQAHTMRYEAIKADPAGELVRLAIFLGHRFDDGQIAAAVDFASFEALREKERQGFFASNVLRPADSDNPDTFKVRKGEVGGWRAYFNEAEQERLDALTRERLAPGLAYR